MNPKTLTTLFVLTTGALLLRYSPEQMINLLGGWSLSALSCLLAYGLGSIPFGLILSKLFLKQDIRQTGSGNTGTTNVLRTGNKGLALLTLVLDAGKGALAVWYLPAFFPVLEYPESAFIIASFVILGHIFPLWLNGSGGKGVATALGVLFTLSWILGFVFLGTWVLIAFTTRYSSLAALVASFLTPIYAYAFAGPNYAIFTICLGLLLVYCHRSNIKNLIRGTESKIGERNKHPSSK